MADPASTAALAVTACGLLLAAAVLVVTRGQVTVALPVLLELLMAAGLLRLSAEQTWRAIATAAAFVLIRKVAVFGMRTGRRTRPAPVPPERVGNGQLTPPTAHDEEGHRR